MRNRENNSYYLKLIGANVKTLRLSRRLSATAVARASLIPLNVYRALEAGRYDADLRQIFALSQVLKVHPREFFQGIELAARFEVGSLVATKSLKVKKG
jgi:transcriptional regulator with XRE-family HTH domain